LHDRGETHDVIGTTLADNIPMSNLFRRNLMSHGSVPMTTP
jgi:hypothetical protein